MGYEIRGLTKSLSATTPPTGPGEHSGDGGEGDPLEL